MAAPVSHPGGSRWRSRSSAGAVVDHFGSDAVVVIDFAVADRFAFVSGDVRAEETSPSNPDVVAAQGRAAMLVDWDKKRRQEQVRRAARRPPGDSPPALVEVRRVREVQEYKLLHWSE